MRILITGGGGNLATIIKNSLHDKYDILNPSHKELDLLNIDLISTFLKNHSFDIIIHTAILGGRRTKEDENTIFYKNILMFENLLKFSDHFKLIINLDSAAIYDRSTDIFNRKECELISVPTDYYGFSKYIIYFRTLLFSNIINFRIFNIFHKEEEENRFIKSCFLAKSNNTDITIFEDKYFDFFYETDFVRVIEYYINHIDNINDLPKTLNLCYNEKYKLSDIAKKIGIDDLHIKIISENTKKNYSGNSDMLYSLPIVFNGFEKSLEKYVN
jgi:nucleoside-diphosphate-sugar epimerase